MRVAMVNALAIDRPTDATQLPATTSETGRRRINYRSVPLPAIRDLASPASGAASMAPTPVTNARRFIACGGGADLESRVFWFPHQP